MNQEQAAKSIADLDATQRRALAAVTAAHWVFAAVLDPARGEMREDYRAIVHGILTAGGAEDFIEHFTEAEYEGVQVIPPPVSCAFCGEVTGWEEMSDHLRTCAEHPMAALLDAARFALTEALAYAGEEENDDSPNGEIIRRLRAAIAKAEGGAG